MNGAKTCLRVLLCLVAAGVALGGRAYAQDPAKVDASHFKVVFENDRVRVLEYQSKPGEKNPTHSHPAHLIYAVTGGKVKHTLPDGKTAEREMTAGGVAWSDPTTHASENIGAGALRAILVELKK